MKRVLFVISDLHLGGAVGFQMCGPEERGQLASFINALRGYASKTASEQVELVINGDFVDFLAEARIGTGAPRWEAFTEDPEHAVLKLQRIATEVAPEVFKALEAFVVAGNRLLILLGNHDIELSVPPVRRKLLELVGGSRGRVEFVYDGEAYVDGEVLIEHGNRYDGWNQVWFDDLRHYRSALTRREPLAGLFDPPPGSQLVVQVMNGLKEEHPWVDLLKPEKEVTLRIIAALEPSAVGKLHAVAKLAYRASARDPKDGITLKAIAENDAIPEELNERGVVKSNYTDDELRALWAEASAETSAVVSIASGNPLVNRFRAIVASIKKAMGDLRDTALLEHLQQQGQPNEATFELAPSNDPEQQYAARLLKGDTKLVLFGHTHLARKMPLDRGLYINTGTWVPLIRLPEKFVTPGEVTSELATELREGLKSGRWRHAELTFARVELLDGRLQDAALNVWRDSSLTTEYEGFPCP